MTANDLKNTLKERISTQDAEALRCGTEGLCISGFNREVCLRLLDDGSEDSAPVPAEKIIALEKELTDYLNTYMQDRPEGHKWIIMACEYLTYIERLPMHPQHAAKWTEKDGNYYCPNMEPESLTCSCCVCRPVL